MIALNTLISLNMTENNGGTIISDADYKLEKNKYLKKQYNGLLASSRYASKVLLKNGNRVKVHFVFSDKVEMNAYVSRLRTKKNSQYLIVCYSGIFYKIKNLFSWILTLDNILPDIKRKRGRPVESKRLSEYFIKDRRIDLSRLEMPFVLVGPQKMDHASKDLRNDYTLLLTSLATEFLFFHEMTHIDHGHIDYLKNINSGFDVLFSTDVENQNAKILFDKSKAIELEADRGSSEFLFDSYWNLAYPGTHMKKFSRLLTSNEELVFAIAYSLIWLFHLVQQYRISCGQTAARSHPSPECRILSVFRIFYILSERKNGNPDLVFEQFKKAGVEYLICCETLNIDAHITADTFNKDSSADKELAEVNALHLQILPEMRPFQFDRKSGNITVP